MSADGQDGPSPEQDIDLAGVRRETPGDATRVAAQAPGLGPLLFLRGWRDGRLLLTALVVPATSGPAPALMTDEGPAEARPILERGGRRVFRYAFSVPATRQASYRLGDQSFPVNAALEGDLRIAFVSCNGQEDDDRATPLAERNALWARLCRQHTERPFGLLLHGGDQIYADEILLTHPALRAWARRGRRARAGNGLDPAMRDTIADALFARYVEICSQPELAWLMARVPSLAMWDDHDICDGWGSLPPAKLDSAIGRTLFAAAREHFLVFQMGEAPDAVPDICLDRTGASLGWSVKLPGLHVIAPDLRSERRPKQVMGQRGWAGFRDAVADTGGCRVLVLSSVPALGPRLSVVEKLMSLTPALEKYEDDLRDQWQSRSHRAEWQDFLRCLIDRHMQEDTRVTVLSGEIHLATRATLATGTEPLHQLVASGIAHPPPPTLYARLLGTLARFGESPLPDHPIRLHPLPGKSAIYTAQRNYLILERQGGSWSAIWELEMDGATPPLAF